MNCRHCRRRCRRRRRPPFWERLPLLRT